MPGTARNGQHKPGIMGRRAHRHRGLNTSSPPKRRRKMVPSATIGEFVETLLVRALLHGRWNGGHAGRSLNRGVIALLHFPEAIVIAVDAAGPIRFAAISRLKHDGYDGVSEVPRADPQRGGCSSREGARLARGHGSRSGGRWRGPRRGGGRADHNHVVAHVRVVHSRSALLILPGKQGRFLAGRNRLVRHFLARIDARYVVGRSVVGNVIWRA